MSHSMEPSISFDPARCIECHACEVACAVWRNLETGIRHRRVRRVWQGVFPEVRCNAAMSACHQCAGAPCVDACPVGAIAPRNPEGVVAVDQEACVGCRVCLDACPEGVPQFGTEGKMQKCDLCNGRLESGREAPPCVATCPTGALAWRA
nr:4Fe-4S dicluster domain-containing protein [uncultured Holophaga sp.]